MFYYISGKLAKLDGSFAVVDAGGVGFKMTISKSTYYRLTGKENTNDVKLYTYMAVRDDGTELFGFSTKAELDAFKLLITVSGVGPKAAMSILSLFTPKKLAYVIASEDTKSISRAPGVGGKTAARVVLELKDKFPKAFPEFDSSPVQESPKAQKSAADKTKLKDAQDALAVLGYSRSEIAAAMKNVNMDGSVEDIIRESLAALMKN